MTLDDDDDTYVTIGTPFEIPEESEPLKKPAKIEDQIAVDKQGRRRFHGAFTGGFSAGYYNTVGSKEGWAPATFRSSRQLKGDEEPVAKTFTPEDFMDEEDFAEHGIAPRKLKTASLYDSTEKELETRKRHLQKAVDDGDVHSAIPGGLPMGDLLLPSKLSIGITLLKKMGWKPGQGIGEKVDVLEEKMDDDVSKKKTYGCVRPAGSHSNLDSMDMKTFVGLLAPKDIQPFQFSRKDNLHGIGYSGIDPTTAMFGGTNSKPSTFKPTGKEKRGIKGQAFGVGVFEEEDEDIYGYDQLSNYDLTMGGEDETDQSYGWTGYNKQDIKKGCLPGFTKSSVSLVIAVPIVSIKIPAGFIPKHVFLHDENAGAKQQDVNQSKPKLSSKDRSLLLGDSTKTLDDVSAWTLKWDKKPQQDGNKTERSKTEEESGNDCTSSEEKSKNKRFSSRWDMEINQERKKPTVIHPPSSQATIIPPPSSQQKVDMYDANTGAFKPFAKNPAKQSRYEEFLAARRTGDEIKSIYDKSFTEWEREREIEEFTRAAVLYRPLSSSIATRFTRATIVTANVDENVANTGEKESCEEEEDKKAARMGMFGKLTRTVLEWHPDKILCKRFNIPPPYTNSNIKGVPGRGSKQKSNSFFGDDMPRQTPAAMLKDRSKPNDEEGDDELNEMLKRKEKLKNKSSKIKIGPLSHLNNMNDAPKKDLENQLPSITDSVIGTETEKPSMDLFKAIFDSSDSSSDESHEGETTPSETKTGETKASSVSGSVANASQTNTDMTGHSSIHEQPMKTTPQESEPAKSQHGDNRRKNQGPPKERIAVRDSKSNKSSRGGSKFLSFLNHERPANRLDYSDGEKEIRHDKDAGNKTGAGYSYRTNTQTVLTSSQTKTHFENDITRLDKQDKNPRLKTSESDESDKCWEEKELPRHKKHKKHKKHSNNREKHKHKQKKKKKKRRKPTSSSSDEQSGDDDSIVPSNMELLMKLKKVSSTLKRPSAADFM